MDELVVGADIGGTSTRVAVADTTGRVLGMAVGGPGNPNSVGVWGSAARISSVMARALAEVPGRVVAVVIGLAGGSRAAADPDFLRAAVPPRVDLPAALVSDLTVAFCSATPDPGGYVLVAGTGAVAGEVAGTELVQQRDGWGWLLGDEGSGFWIGRAAVRSTLAALQEQRPLGPLQRDVLAMSGTGGYLDLLQACYQATPTWLAEFSPLVSRHAGGDPAAAEIADQAVLLLLDLLLGLHPRPGEPIVLAGSVLAQDGPVSRSFRHRLAQLEGAPGEAREVLSASTGVVGALWLAVQPWVVDPSATHARLSATARRWG